MPTVRQRYRRTDRQTDGRTDGRLTIAIPRFALRASRGKNGPTFLKYQPEYTSTLYDSRPTMNNIISLIIIIVINVGLNARCCSLMFFNYLVPFGFALCYVAQFVRAELALRHSTMSSTHHSLCGRPTLLFPSMITI